MAAIAYVPCAALRVISIELFAVLWACPVGYMTTIPKGLLCVLLEIRLLVYYARG